MPLTIQAPPRAPMKSRMMRAVATWEMFWVMVCSNLRHGTRANTLPITQQMAALMSSTTWLGPLSESLP